MLTGTILKDIIKIIGNKSNYIKFNLLDPKLPYSLTGNKHICSLKSCSTGITKTINHNINKNNTKVINLMHPFQIINQRYFISSHKITHLCKGQCFHCRSMQLSYQQKRNKSKNHRKNPEYDSASDSEEEEDNVQGTKLITLRTETLRMDGILKKALGVARNKLEAQFYGGNLRVNGRKPDKKSFQLRIGDEVDLIRGSSPMNPDFLSVSRVEVVSIKEAADEDGENQLIVKVRRTKAMSIENYQESPWKKGSSAE